MLRFLLAACAAVLLLLPVTAEGSSATRLRGVVSAKDVARSAVTVSSVRRDWVLRVPSSALDRIRVGLRVELRGSLLRSRGRGPTRILARDVVLVRSELRVQGAREDLDDDELELKGTLTSLTPLTVSDGVRSATCSVPAGLSLAGFAVGDFVEITCDLRAGTWVLRKLELEDDADAVRDDLEDDEIELKGTLTSLTPLTVSDGVRSATCSVPAGLSLAGFAAGDFVEITCDLRAGTWVLRKLELEDDASAVRDDDDDRSGPGGGDDDDDDDDRSGPGRGDDGDGDDG